VAGWLAVALTGAAPAGDRIAAAQVGAMPAMPRPGYLQPAADPVFGTPFTRVTAPGRQILPGVDCGPAYCTHRYSGSQAWNADQSLLAIVNGCRGSCFLFLDGRTYRPLFRRTVPGECEWHPTDPALMSPSAPVTRILSP
jgi:hypothetical protein